jgi:hypothetical protein
MQAISANGLPVVTGQSPVVFLGDSCTVNGVIPLWVRMPG